MARYKDALFWIVANDDTDWLNYVDDPKDACGTPSVTATMVADLFGKDTEQVTKDLLAERKRQEKT
jgi:hypothetical protein